MRDDGGHAPDAFASGCFAHPTPGYRATLCAWATMPARKTMITRRLFCGCLAAALPFASTAHAQPSRECAVFTPERQKATAPDEAIARLKDGNARFMAGKPVNCDLMAQVRQTASNQSPFAAIV